jgi:8-oxo-dGTP diphosphatase
MAKGPLTFLPGVSLVLHEIARHLLRRPVVGIAVVGRTPDGRVLLIRRADTGQWALPGGTLEWGETLKSTAVREVHEEAGATVLRVGRVTGVYSRPDRDPRFHGVTVVVVAELGPHVGGPKNALEIREARLFEEKDLPSRLSMDMHEMLEHAMHGTEPVLE